MLIFSRSLSNISTDEIKPDKTENIENSDGKNDLRISQKLPGISIDDTDRFVKGLILKY